MLHVFVETNWVVDFVAPFQGDSAARELFQLATQRRIQLHLPAICLNEAKNTIAQFKSQARTRADGIRAFLRSKPEANSELEREVVYRVLDRYESANRAEIARFEHHLSELVQHPNVEVFPLDDEMLNKALELSGGDFAGVDPFDQAILAGILVRAERIDSSEWSIFCEKDGDLLDYTRSGEPRRFLQEVYQKARLKLQDSFDIQDFLPAG